MFASLTEVLRLLHELMDRKVRVHLFIALLIVIAGALLSALAPLALKAMVDTVAAFPAEGSTALDPRAWLAGVLYLAALCGARILADIRPLVVDSADHRLHTRLTQRFFAHLLGVPLAYLLKRHGGEWPHSLEMATAGFKLIVAQAVNGILPVAVEIAAMAFVLAHLNQPAQVAVFLATAVVYLLIFSLSAGALMRRARGVSSASLEMHAYLNDALQHVEVLRSFAAEEGATGRLQSACERQERSWLQVNRLRTGIALAATATFAGSLAGSLLLAGNAVANGSLSIGGFVLANVYMLQMVRPLEALVGAARDIAQCLGMVQPFIEIVREPSQGIEQAATTPTAPLPTDAARQPAGPSVEFEDVTFGYEPERPVLNRLSLSVPAGRTLGIVGASGSGKSSIGRLLLRLYAPQSGCIRMNGRPIEAWPLATLRQRIGLVPQDTSLFHVSLADNVRLGRPAASRDDVERAARCAQLHEFIASLPEGHDTLVGERGLRLSGGERQRVAIARALIKRPDIFVFDEATSMLDTTTERAVMDRLRDYTAGCTVIVIAHRLSTVMHADEIVVLDRGQVAERGSHELLLSADGSYARLWRQQARETT